MARTLPAFTSRAERFQRFVLRRLRIVLMRLIKVDIVGLQPPQRAFAGRDDIGGFKPRPFSSTCRAWWR